MKKRVITATVYVVVLIGLLALKWLVDKWGALGFDVLFCAIAVIGSLELLKATKVCFPNKVITVAFCSAIVPAYVIGEMTMGLGFALVGLLAAVCLIALGILWALHTDGSNSKHFLLSLFAMVYVGLLSCLLSVINHLQVNSVAAILFLFLNIMLTDSFAFVIGIALKRWIPLKLAPSISPNKTVIGGIGGLIGGMVAAVAAYYIYYGLTLVIGTPLVYTGSIPAVVIFLLAGLVTAIFAQAGDLFESYIKRKCGVKDMGKILPGHGGVLDRFDSILFAGIFVLISFALLI